MLRIQPLLRTLLLGSVALAGTAAAQIGDDCKYGAERAATAATVGVKKVVIATGAGYLRVRGQSDATAIRAEGRACASKDALLKEIQLESRREGDTIYLRSVLPSTESVTDWFDASARLDLSVTLPVHLAVEIEDGSGDLELQRVHSAVVADGSGELQISDIAGDLTVTDSSGAIDIERVGGNLRLTDSSGEIDIEDVTGNVDIPIDSSGNLQVERVRGTVHIFADSSGNITLRDIGGDALVDSDSSGNIHVQQVGGKLVVGADGSGRIVHEQVQGGVELPRNRRD